MTERTAGRPMGGRRELPPVDYDQLAAALKALAYGARLELLDALRFPRTLGEIELTPRRGGAGHEPAKTAARSTVLAHLEKLQAARLVEAGEITQGGQTVSQYEVNPSEFYALIEELRRLSTMYAGRGPIGEETGTLGTQPQEDQDVDGPHLVLVHGVYEGKVFPLDASTAADGVWTIGRSREAGISLDYDPYVSASNARIVEEDDRFVLEDLGSKNGTAVNWQPLEPGQRRELGPADVVGVGRSLLVYAPG